MSVGAAQNTRFHERIKLARLKKKKKAEREHDEKKKNLLQRTEDREGEGPARRVQEKKCTPRRNNSIQMVTSARYAETTSAVLEDLTIRTVREAIYEVFGAETEARASTERHCRRREN